MLLGKLIKNIKPAYKSIKFNNIRFNSKDCKKNDIFFSIQGNKFNGNNYINEAIKKGAKIIVSEKKIVKKKENIVYLNSSNVRKILANVSYKILGRKKLENYWSSQLL